VLNNDVPTNLIRYGDLIQFNCQGPLFSIVNTSNLASQDIIPIIAPGSTLTCDTGGLIVPWNNTTPQNASYRIFRSAIKSGATPLQLPATTVIDLDYSGLGSGNGTVVPFGNSANVEILFAPNGSVLKAIYSTNASGVITQPLFLLVGKRERVNIPFVLNNTDPSTMANCQDLTNLWVVINPQTGLVTTGEVAAATTATDLQSTVTQSRALARDAQSMGGK
jgi:hypothetical protein